jgi:hypothetical protein
MRARASTCSWHIGGNVGDPPFTHELLDLSTIDAARFSSEAEHPADLVQIRLCPAKRREHIADVDRIIRVAG